MRENSIGSLFAREIVQASTRVNYAQNIDKFHGLETMVCMAANGAMSVEGGNWQIFANMIASAKASIMLETNVTAIKQVGNEGLALTYESLSPERDSQETLSRFDDIILAAPHQYSNINLSSFSLKPEPDHTPYVHLHVTLFTSPHLLSPVFFGLPPDKATPQVIITTLPPDEHPPHNATVGSPGFYSISLLRDITNPHTGAQEYAYKIFSPAPPNNTFLRGILGLSNEDEIISQRKNAPIYRKAWSAFSTLFGAETEAAISDRDITWLYRKEWHSYPYEYPRDSFDDIELSPGLWYTAGIERFISTMETSALMGKNVARLVIARWEGGLPSYD